MRYCSDCGTGHECEVVSEGRTDPAVEIARINAKRDVEIARMEYRETMELAAVEADTAVVVTETGNSRRRGRSRGDAAAARAGQPGR